ncbi:MAG: Mut7-C RNAse domain-containing protein [Bacteroidales bacterium]
MPSHIHIRFYEELNDFLPSRRKKTEFRHRFNGTPTIKDIIESIGIPHVEVDLVLANGEPVGFSYKPSEGDRVSVYPVFESMDISPVNRLRPEPLRVPRFILDVHLGKLARNLRMLGFDSCFDKDLDDPGIIEAATREQRTILTRDLGILKNGKVQRGYYVRNIHPPEQLREVLERFDLKGKIKPYSRCMQCNGRIEKVDKEAIIDRLEPGTKKCFNEFYRCSNCGKIYWKGTHIDDMNLFIHTLLKM